MTEQEKFYDEEIAPALRAIMEKCNAKGMSLVAMVEYKPGEFATSRLMQPETSLPMVMLSHCAKMGLNIDGYIIGLLRYCNEKGIKYDQSIVMQQMSGSGK